MPAPPDTRTLTTTDRHGGDGVDSLFAPTSRAPGGAGAAAKASPPAVPAASPSVEALSRRYRDECRLDYADRVLDGFCDHIGDAIIINASHDERLDSFIHKSRKKLQKASDPVTLVMVMGLLVSDACGGSGQDVGGIEERFRQRVREQPTGFLLGQVLGDAKAKKKKAGYAAGVGLSRHRALLLKCLADHMAGPEVTLERDKQRPVAWNCVKLDQVVYIIDLMHDPGVVYESGSHKHKEYLRLLEPGNSAKWTTTISVREDLSGRVPRPSWHVEVNDLNHGRGDKDQLGTGGFGEVYKGIWADTAVAIKVVKDKSPTDYDVMDFVLEIALLSRLNHPNVMRFWRGCVDLMDGRRVLLMVTEYISRGGLSGLLHGHGGKKLSEPLTLPQALCLSLGCARGMQYLHSCKVLHLDLKSPNVLVDNDWTPKLCDFGLAKITAMETDQGFQTTLRGVSPIWAPPEMFDDKADSMTEKADVYSYGIVFFEIASGKLPFQEISQRQLPKAKFDGVLPQIPSGVQEDCGKLIHDCCAHRPSSRPSMRGVVARLLDFAEVRKLCLDRVVMPSWQGSTTGKPGDGAAEDVPQKSGTNALQAKLEEERVQLKKQLKDTKEQRIRLQEAHLGKAMSKEEIEPLLPAEQPPQKGGADLRETADSVADSGSEVKLVTQKDTGGEKKCCVVL